MNRDHIAYVRMRRVPSGIVHLTFSAAELAEVKKKAARLRCIPSTYLRAVIESAARKLSKKQVECLTSARDARHALARERYTNSTLESLVERELLDHNYSITDMGRAVLAIVESRSRGAR